MVRQNKVIYLGMMYSCSPPNSSQTIFDLFKSICVLSTSKTKFPLRLVTIPPPFHCLETPS